MIGSAPIVTPACPFRTGDYIEVLKVGSPLPQTLVGSFGTISSLLYLDSSSAWVATVELPQGSYTLSIDSIAWRRLSVAVEPPKLNNGSAMWLEARMRHYERIIPKLAGNPLHVQMVRSMQAEYEQVLAALGINDEEVEF